MNTTGVVIQSDVWKCDPATLNTLIKILGINATINEFVNLSKTDFTGTSIYNLIQASNMKGLNLITIAIGAEGLKHNDIVLLEINSDYHYSLILSINDSDVLIRDSNFANIYISRETFNEIYSGYSIVYDLNRIIDYTILSDEQIKNILGVGIYLPNPLHLIKINISPKIITTATMVVMGGFAVFAGYLFFASIPAAV